MYDIPCPFALEERIIQGGIGYGKSADEAWEDTVKCFLQIADTDYLHGNIQTDFQKQILNMQNIGTIYNVIKYNIQTHWEFWHNL